MQRLLPIFLVLFSFSVQAQSPVISRLLGNERLGKKDSVANWTIHFQFTGVFQGHPAFQSAYRGDNSLFNQTENGALTITSSVF